MESAVGTVPERRLPWRLSRRRNASEPSSDGMYPVRFLPATARPATRGSEELEEEVLTLTQATPGQRHGSVSLADQADSAHDGSSVTADLNASSASPSADSDAAGGEDASTRSSVSSSIPSEQRSRLLI